MSDTPPTIPANTKQKLNTKAQRHKELQFFILLIPRNFLRKQIFLCVFVPLCFNHLYKEI